MSSSSFQDTARGDELTFSTELSLPPHVQRWVISVSLCLQEKLFSFERTNLFHSLCSLKQHKMKKALSKVRAPDAVVQPDTRYRSLLEKQQRLNNIRCKSLPENIVKCTNGKAVISLVVLVIHFECLAIGMREMHASVMFADVNILSMVFSYGYWNTAVEHVQTDTFSHVSCWFAGRYSNKESKTLMMKLQ